MIRQLVLELLRSTGKKGEGEESEKVYCTLCFKFWIVNKPEVDILKHKQGFRGQEGTECFFARNKFDLIGRFNTKSQG